MGTRASSDIENATVALTIGEGVLSAPMESVQNAGTPDTAVGGKKDVGTTEEDIQEKVNFDSFLE